MNKPQPDDSDTHNPTLRSIPPVPSQPQTRADRQKRIAELRHQLSGLQHQRHSLVRECAHDLQNGDSGFFGSHADVRSLSHQIEIDLGTLRRFRDRFVRLAERAEDIVTEIDDLTDVVDY